MFFSSGNLTARIFERQIRTPRPSTSVNFVRQFYENLVPNHTEYDIDCPDIYFRKFTDDGQYLISFSKNYQELIVYRPRGLSFSCKEDDCYFDDVSKKEKRFDSYFNQLYSIPLASNNEVICKDFFLYMDDHQFGLFATSTMQVQDPTFIQGGVHGIPSIEKTTFHLLRLEDGVILDEKVFHNDFIHVTSCMGVFLYDDLISVVSILYQTIHIFQIRDSGNLVEVRRIGLFCRDDDELFLNSHAQVIATEKNKPIISSFPVENSTEHPDDTERDTFFSGIKQRLLSFIFREIWNEKEDDYLKVPLLRKKFYFHFQDYANLVIWKVQFLDRHHLFIKFGSAEGAVSRSTEIHHAFFAVYNMETTEIMSFYQSPSDELYLLFEKFCSNFHVASRNSLHVNFVSSYSNNLHALELLKAIKSKSTYSSQFVKKILALLPFTCQSQSPSPYFDQSLFRYDEKLISSMERHRQALDYPIKFILRRQPNTPKFKIKPGPDSGSADARQKRIYSFLFHPFLPFVISVQHTFMQSTVVNVHFRR